MNFKPSNMTVNMKFILVCVLANAIFCNGLPQDYCQHEIDHDEMVDCDEAGDNIRNTWPYGQLRGFQPGYDQLMTRNVNDEGYYGNPRRFRPQDYMPETKNLNQNYESSRDYLKSRYQNPISHLTFADNMRFAKSAQMQPLAYPGHYYESLAAHDEPSYYYPMVDYYGGYSPDEYEEEFNNDCPNGKCPQSPLEADSKRASGKKSKKNHDKRHNSRAENMSPTKIANEASMIHADEVDEETNDKDSWGIDRREKQKNKEQETAKDNVKGKRSIEKENIKVFKEKQENLERFKKDVKQVSATNGEENILGKKTFIHQIMHIPKKM